MFFTEDEVLMGVKTLIKMSVRDLLLCWFFQWGGHYVVDHNPTCHCYHFLR